MTYYSTNPDGSIALTTKDADVARSLGLSCETEREIVQAWDGKQYFEGEAPAKPVRVRDYDSAMEQHLRSEQTARGYTTRSPAEYAASSNARWAQDAKDWIAHVTDVMEYGLSVQNEYEAGRPVPSLEEFKAALPEIEWTFKDAQ